MLMNPKFTDLSYSSTKKVGMSHRPWNDRDMVGCKMAVHLKMDGWNMKFPFGMAYLQVRTVNFRECNQH